MTIYNMPDDLVTFAHNGVDKFEGMLNKSASILCALLAYQMKMDGKWSDQSFLEIGVYKGKFLALIEFATRGTAAEIIGVDPFCLSNQNLAEVSKSLEENGLDMKRITLHEGYSTDEALLTKAAIGKSFSLIHIDGSHQAEIVYKDMLLADRLVAKEGFVIADDFFNRSALGVLTAVSQLMMQKQINLEPWALLNTKLVFCRKGRSSEVQKSFIEALRQNVEIKMFGDFINEFDNGLNWRTEQSLFNSKILVL